MNNDYEFGYWAENLAAQYLEDKGYHILDRNYRKPWGEIDIVAEKGGILIFVEVKANRVEAAGFEPEKRVNAEKLRRMHRAIETYLAYKKFESSRDRQIDVLSLVLARERGVVRIVHFKNIEI